MTTSAAHWRHLWSSWHAEEFSWFEASPVRSRGLIHEVAGDRGAPIIDVGGGASRLVDALLDDGYRDVTVLDIADAALARARERLQARATAVTWAVADVLRWAPTRPYDLWHDRAVLHFLVEPEARLAYADRLRQALAHGGHAVIATFAPDGPEQCSGLPVQRFSADEIAALLGDGFALVRHHYDTHRTPSGAEQRFAYALLRRDG